MGAKSNYQRDRCTNKITRAVNRFAQNICVSNIHTTAFAKNHLSKLAKHASKWLPLSVILSALLVAGCGSSSRVRYNTPQDAYESGKARYDEEKYDLAILFFQGVFDFGRTHEWAAGAQLFLARSYRGNKDFLLAANEYARFTQIYRSDPRVADAEYELALTYYDRSPSYDFDQTDTERAIEQFRLFISRYQDHVLVIEAQNRIVELREKLAKKKLNIAQMYERIFQYEAAAMSFERIFDDYYDSSLADDALVGAMRNYLEYGSKSIANKQAERYQLVIDHYDRLIQIFPDSPLIKEAEVLFNEATRLLGETQTDS